MVLSIGISSKTKVAFHLKKTNDYSSTLRCILIAMDFLILFFEWNAKQWIYVFLRVLSFYRNLKRTEDLLQKQCQVAVLPLGTGNDLARVLGWGSSCDDDTHLPQLLEKYEKASTKMLDRWSIMAFERTIAMPKLSLTPGLPEGQLHNQIIQYEDSLVSHLQNILQSDETSVILNSAKRLCETVKDFATQVVESSLTQGKVRFITVTFIYCLHKKMCICFHRTHIVRGLILSYISTCRSSFELTVLISL